MNVNFQHLVMASDGIWDVLDKKEVKELFGKNYNADEVETSDGKEKGVD